MKQTITNKPLIKQSEFSPEFDLEMLYVECSRCSRPVIWEKGTTTYIIQSSGIEDMLGSEWLLLSNGCPSCSPQQKEFLLSLARPASPPATSMTDRFN